MIHAALDDNKNMNPDDSIIVKTKLNIFIKCILNILELNKGLNLMFPPSTDGIS